jgi:hypothetical protein
MHIAKTGKNTIFGGVKDRNSIIGKKCLAQ